MSEGKKIGVLVAIVGVVWAYGKISGETTPPEPKPSPASAAAPAPAPGPSDPYRLMMAEKDVKKRLRDPASAQFSDLTVRNGVVCGQVNSRNGFGGMTGPQQFISRLGVMTVFKDDVADGGFADTWDSLCV